MTTKDSSDVFAKWRAKQPRKLYRVFYLRDAYDVWAHTESEAHEQLQLAIPTYSPKFSKIKINEI